MELNDEFKRNLATSLIDCWHADKNMQIAISRACVMSGGCYSDIEFPKLSEAIKVRFVDVRMSAKRFLAANFRYVSDLLFDGRKREQCEEALSRHLRGVKKPKKNKANLPIKFRDRDFRGDWKTVK